MEWLVLLHAIIATMFFFLKTACWWQTKLQIILSDFQLLTLLRFT